MAFVPDNLLKPRSARRAFLGIHVLLLFTGCSPAFKSVAATGGLGEMVGNHGRILSRLPFHCELLREAGDLDSRFAACQDESKRVSAEMTRGAQALSDYGRALKNLAAYDDTRIRDRLAAFLQAGRPMGDLASPPPGLVGRLDSVSNIVAALAGLIVRGWRRHEIEELVKKADPAIQALAEKLDARAKLVKEPLQALAATEMADRRRMLQMVREMLPKDLCQKVQLRVPTQKDQKDAAAALKACQETIGGALKLYGPPATFSLLQLRELAAAEYGDLLRFQQALSAFRTAHRTLVESIEKHKLLTDDDPEIYKELNERIVPILQEFDNLIEGPQP